MSDNSKPFVVRKLTRLFNGRPIIKKAADGQLRTIDLTRMQSAGNINSTHAGDRYNKLYTSYSAAQPNYNNPYTFQATKTSLYADYEAMDQDTIISTALDIYADETVLKDDFGKIIRVSTDDQEVKQVLENLFYDILNLEFNLWQWVRTMCKYGDCFLHLEIAEEYGIINVSPLSSYDVVREEQVNPKGEDTVEFYLTQGTSTTDKFQLYEIAHFRLIGDSNYLPYGKSMIEAARKEWKKLCLMEDAMLIQRITRAPEKRHIKVDTGNLSDPEVDVFMQNFKNQLKRAPLIDKNGQYNYKYNLMNITEDFYSTKRGDSSGIEIETLPGLEFNAIEDIEYIRNRMLAGLHIPKAFLGYDEALCISPNTLIPLLNGKEKTVKELIEDHKNGIKNYTYSIDEKTFDIVPGEILWAGYTRLDAQIVKVHLDNGKFIECTPDHRFMTRDGKWIEAQYLTSGESLMPWYTRLSDEGIKGYVEVYNPSTGTWKYVHRLVADYYNLRPYKGTVVHHIDLDKLNNNPDNLDCTMDKYEHVAYHSILNGGSKDRLFILLDENPDSRKQIASKGGKNAIGKLKNWIKENGAWNKGKSKYRTKKCKNCDAFINSNIYCTNKCKSEYLLSHKIIPNVKYAHVDFDFLARYAQYYNSIREFCHEIRISRTLFSRIVQEAGLTNTEFKEQYIGKSLVEEYKNHKVVKVEFLSERIDTCDLTIKDHHNFATSAGVIIHNSGKAVLAAEDVRFARTIERIQHVVVAELHKMAIVHLVTQGYAEDRLLGFDISMTSPSVVYEQEKLALFATKTELARDMMEQKLFPREWIYREIFNQTGDDIAVIKESIVEDAKYEYRLTTIADQGKDPAAIIPEKKIGEDDFADEEGAEDTGDGTDQPVKQEDLRSSPKRKTPEVPEGGWEGAGRPSEPVRYNSHEHPRGYDPLGSASYKNARTEGKFKMSTLKMVKHSLKDILNNPSILTEETE